MLPCVVARAAAAITLLCIVTYIAVCPYTPAVSGAPASRRLCEHEGATVVEVDMDWQSGHPLFPSHTNTTMSSTQGNKRRGPIRIRFFKHLTREPLLTLLVRHHPHILHHAANVHSTLHQDIIAWYSGIEADHPDNSYARLSISRELAHMNGWVRTGDDWFSIESTLPGASTEPRGDGGSSRLLACVTRAHDVPFKPVSLSHPHMQHPGNATTAEGSGRGDPGARRRRAGPQSNAHTMCSVYLDYDVNFLREWGGSCWPNEDPDLCRARKHIQAQTRVIDVLHMVAGVYEDPANFDGDVISFQIRGIYYTGSGVGLPTGANAQEDASSILRAYQEWLGKGASNGKTRRVRGQGEPTSQEVCLNHFFTHTDAGGTLGVASRGSTETNIAGGICSDTIFLSNEGPYVVNTGFTTTRSSGTVPLLQTVLVTAHELGHNAGAPHDCCESRLGCGQYPSCSASPGSHRCYPSGEQGGTYLMHPQITNNVDARNARRFSPCSVEDISSVVAAKGSCLELADPCRYGGACCDAGGNALPTGTLCRSADPTEPCLGEGRCTGEHAQCPPGLPLDDGAFCSMQDNSGDTTRAVCHQGTCSHIHEAFCRATLGLPGCTLESSPCIRACANDQGCYPYSGQCDGSSGTVWDANAPCEQAPATTPCETSNGADGTCTDQGSCVPCGADGCAASAAESDAVTCNWFADGSFSSCTVACGGGTQTREYKCICSDGTQGDRLCVGQKPEAEVRDCNTQTCSLDCTCDAWSQWSECSANCEGGEQSRSRTCTDAQDGGKTCAELELQETETRVCNTDPCPVDCLCNNWSAWSSCSVSCGEGIRSRSRTCTDPQHGGTSCESLGLDVVETEACQEDPCPVDCACEEWGPWSPCSASCGEGMTTSTRACSEAKHGGRTCSDLGFTDTRSQLCLEASCPVPCDDATGCVSADACLVPGDMANVTAGRTNSGFVSGACMDGMCSLVPVAADTPCTSNETDVADGTETRCVFGVCAVTRRDCVPTPWSEWTQCSQCARQRQRAVLRERIGNGSGCGGLAFTGACCGVELLLTPNGTNVTSALSLSDGDASAAMAVMATVRIEVLTALRAVVDPSIFVATFDSAVAMSTGDDAMLDARATERRRRRRETIGGSSASSDGPSYRAVVASPSVDDETLAAQVESSAAALSRRLGASVSVVRVVPDPASENSNGNGGSSAGAIVGGVLAGVIVFAMLVAAVVVYQRRKERGVGSGGSRNMGRGPGARGMRKDGGPANTRPAPAVQTTAATQNRAFAAGAGSVVPPSRLHGTTALQPEDIPRASARAVKAPLQPYPAEHACAPVRAAPQPQQAKLHGQGGDASASVEYRASGDYKAEHDGAISLRQNQEVVLHERTNGDWWYVTCDEQTGYAPTSHITTVSGRSKGQLHDNSGMHDGDMSSASYTTSRARPSIVLAQATTTESTVDGHTFTEGHGQGQAADGRGGGLAAQPAYDVADDEASSAASVGRYDDATATTAAAAGAAARGQGGASGQRLHEMYQVTSMYDWTARNGDELTVSRGAVLTAVCEEGDWLLCRRGRQEGLVPSNYVQRVSAPATQQQQQQQQQQQGPRGLVFKKFQPRQTPRQQPQQPFVKPRPSGPMPQMPPKPAPSGSAALKGPQSGTRQGPPKPARSTKKPAMPAAKPQRPQRPPSANGRKLHAPAKPARPSVVGHAAPRLPAGPASLAKPKPAPSASKPPCPAKPVGKPGAAPARAPDQQQTHSRSAKPPKLPAAAARQPLCKPATPAKPSSKPSGTNALQSAVAGIKPKPAPRPKPKPRPPKRNH